MKRFISLIKVNRFTAAMLLFVAVFYTIVIFGDAAAKKKSQSLSAISQSERIKPEEFKKKEELFEKNIVKKPGLVGALSLVILLAFLAGILLDVRVFQKVRRDGRWILGGLPHEAVSWDWTHVLQAVIFMFFAESILLVLETLFYLAVPGKSIPRDFILMANSLLRDSLVAVFIILLTKRLGHKISALGLTGRDFFKNVARGITGYIAVLPVLFLSLLVLAVITKYMSYEPPPQNVVQIYLKKSSDPYLLFFTLFVAGIGPLIEEIFFRGFTYKAFRQKLGVLPAMMLTSAIFAAFHMNLAAFVPIFILGMMLGYLYEETGSLVPSMTAHALHNLLMINFTLGFKSIAGS